MYAAFPSHNVFLRIVKVTSEQSGTYQGYSPYFQGPQMSLMASFNQTKTVYLCIFVWLLIAFNVQHQEMDTIKGEKQ